MGRVLAVVVVALAAASASAAVSDPWITTKAKIALLTTSELDAARINVDTINGRVTLHGVVGSEAERQRAAEVASSVEGVGKVQNLLQVVPESRRERVAEADAKVEEGVARALEGVPGLAGSDIDVVSVNDGVVLLGGKAETLGAHLQAIVASSRVSGVREVRTQVESPRELRDDEVYHLDTRSSPPRAEPKGMGEVARPSPDGQPGSESKGASDVVVDATRDAWLTTATKTALLADPDVPGLDVNVDTRDGAVTLFGIVATREAKAEAERIAAGVAGVRRVDNALEVVPARRQEQTVARDEALQEEAMRALERSSLLADQTISVEVKNGVARLTGQVSGNDERLAASYVVRATPGVRAVNNDLVVSSRSSR